MSLVQFQDENQAFQLMQSSWAKDIDPIISNPANQSLLLKNVVLVTGTNTINHKLGRKLQGWVVVRLRAAATIYDDQDNNIMPQLTLTLVSSAPVTADIEVF